MALATTRQSALLSDVVAEIKRDELYHIGDDRCELEYISRLGSMRKNNTDILQNIAKRAASLAHPHHQKRTKESKTET